MKKKLLAAGVVSLVIAAALAAINLGKFETTINGPFLTHIRVYPMAFFALLGLVMMFQGLKPLWRR